MIELNTAYGHTYLISLADIRHVTIYRPANYHPGCDDYAISIYRRDGSNEVFHQIKPKEVQKFKDALNRA